MKNDNYRGNRGRGPGRRTYGEPRSGAPRVGRIAEDVPQARRVTGEYHAPRREEFVERDFGKKPVSFISFYKLYKALSAS